MQAGGGGWRWPGRARDQELGCYYCREVTCGSASFPFTIRRAHVADHGRRFSEVASTQAAAGPGLCSGPPPRARRGAWSEGPPAVPLASVLAALEAPRASSARDAERRFGACGVVFVRSWSTRPALAGRALGLAAAARPRPGRPACGHGLRMYERLEHGPLDACPGRALRRGYSPRRLLHYLSRLSLSMLSGSPISCLSSARRGRDLGRQVNQSVGLVDERPAAGRRWGGVARRRAAHVDGGTLCELGDSGAGRPGRPESTTLSG